MISDSSIKKIFKKAGAQKISKEAIKNLKKEIEKYSHLIARKAIKNSQYLGRKIVKLEDVREAIKKISSQYREEFEI